MKSSRRAFIVATAGGLYASGTGALAAGAAASTNEARDKEQALDPPVLDYSNSYVTFVTKGRGNLARLQVESRCVLLDGDGRAIDSFYQFASCKSEHTYAEENLFQDPNYDFSGIFSRDQYVIYRAGMPQTGLYDERGTVAERFEDLLLQIRPARGARVLQQNAEVVEATLDGLPLVGRTEIDDADRGLRAILEYPIKTMNVNDQRQIYQVDTGPVAFPDPTSAAEQAVGRLALAYVAFSGPEQAYFVLQSQITLSAETERAVQVCHYGDIRRMPARNSVLAIEG